MPTMVYALMGRIHHDSFHDEVWLDSIYDSAEAAYSQRREHYLLHFQKQINALNEDPKARTAPEVMWYVSTYELK
jgi:hypothetical protein